MALKSDIIVSHCQAVFKITDKIKSVRLEICHIDYFKRLWRFLQSFGEPDPLPSCSLCYFRIPLPSYHELSVKLEQYIIKT